VAVERVNVHRAKLRDDAPIQRVVVIALDLDVAQTPMTCASALSRAA
jgi:hypothetical protein